MISKIHLDRNTQKSQVNLKGECTSGTYQQGMALLQSMIQAGGIAYRQINYGHAINTATIEIFHYDDTKDPDRKVALSLFYKGFKMARATA